MARFAYFDNVAACHAACSNQNSEKIVAVENFVAALGKNLAVVADFECGVDAGVDDEELLNLKGNKKMAEKKRKKK